MIEPNKFDEIYRKWRLGNLTAAAEDIAGLDRGELVELIVEDRFSEYGFMAEPVLRIEFQYFVLRSVREEPRRGSLPGPGENRADTGVGYRTGADVKLVSGHERRPTEEKK